MWIAAHWDATGIRLQPLSILLNTYTVLRRMQTTSLVMTCTVFAISLRGPLRCRCVTSRENPEDSQGTKAVERVDKDILDSLRTQAHIHVRPQTLARGDVLGL